MNYENIFIDSYLPFLRLMSDIPPGICMNDSTKGIRIFALFKINTATYINY